MKRIFISTNFHQLSNVIYEKRNDILISNIENQDIAYIEDNKIILFNDIILKEFPEELKIKQNFDYLLFHSGTSESIKNLFSNLVPGKHDSKKENKYKPVFEIILNKSDNKIEKIIDLLFSDLMEKKIESKKIDFLYCLYNGQIINDIPKYIAHIPDALILINFFKANKYNKEFDTNLNDTLGIEQREKLTQLRNQILDNA